MAGRHKYVKLGKLLRSSVCRKVPAAKIACYYKKATPADIVRRNVVFVITTVSYHNGRRVLLTTW